jgi:restriction endonuclease Mrr
MTATSYEDLVADLLAQLEKAEPRGLPPLRIARNQKSRGKSGQEHQIDVLVEFERLGLLFTMIVACKHWNQRVGVEQVMVLAQRLEDLAAHKGVIVTTAGFQAGAHTIAASKGIALVLCRDRPEFVIERRDYSEESIREFNPMVRGVYEVKYSYLLVDADHTTHIGLPMLLPT